MLQQSGGSSDGHRERETSQQREKSKLHQKKAKRLISEGKKLQGKLVRYDHRGKTAA